ncbi:MAG TPA: fused MFS/spermidine synthase [Planctomycetota bacterium]|nr:fused MFS/spermidine synthase [Planctomycetota bacterium]HRR81705.1 fused MFS/spermidine synthase [Planctomycetota bacterium]HRT94098.1 fused MFS/spermidine synthase [Planctomycetota bacterium]
MGALGSVYLSAFCIGLCGIVTQVVALREMVVTFHGNELCVGVMLGTWLFWTGLGSLGLGRFAKRWRRPDLWLAWALLAGAWAATATVAGAQCLKIVLREARGGSLGEVRPFGLMLVSALALLAPFCLLNGFLFPLLCRAAEAARGSVGGAYMAEAAGAAAGGAAYTFALVHWLDPIATAFALLGVWSLGALLKGVEERRTQAGKALALLALGGIAAAVFPAAMGRHRFGLGIERRYWAPLVLVDAADSRYGRLAVVRPPSESVQRSLYENGALAFSYPDPPAAEAAAHLPMLQHPEPRKVLLLGGGPGVLEEILKHPSVEKLTYVELDPQVVEMVRGEFAASARGALADARVAVVATDGRAFLKRVSARFDVVMAATGPPATAQANRYYTLEFFREVAEALAPGGVFAFRAPGGHNYIPEETQRLLACLYRTLSQAFPDAIVFPGGECTFLASSEAGRVSYRLGLLAQRMQARDLQTSSVDASVWETELAGGRLEELQRALRAEPPPALNRDLSPRCYYYEAQRWSAMQRARPARGSPSWLDLGALLGVLERRPAAAPLALLALVAAFSLGAPLARGRWRDGALAFSVASTGLIEMGVEFAVLLGFQVACGYLYHYVGAVVAAFMLGLAGGAWVSGRWVRLGRATWGRMRWVQVGICLYPLALPGFLVLAAQTRLGAAPALAGAAFSLVALLAGFVGGLQFPLAAALHSGGGASAGALYGLDLAGACLGALAVSAVLVPVSGIVSVCLMLSGLGALGLFGVLAAGAGRAKTS